ncbi:MAG: SUF system NifU family Fe-S cluster assembly protein [Gammaproteobacteria bacterium RBG_16_66_13]|nr:MAG: SUF system NifU family Fe-S cluster assembly protein [Gammaproteobacteria bacterium RBG_16_66_13]
MWKNPVDDLYGEIVLDHYHKPRNRGSLKEPSVSAEVANVFCGDEVKLDLAIQDGRVTAVRFQGQGCSISQASASMLTQAIMGLSLEDVETLFEAFKGMMNGSDQVDAKSLGDLEALQGVRRFPARVKCATLAWNALQLALERHRKASA